MSNIIKAARFKPQPKLIETPEPPEPSSPGSEELPGFDEAAGERMLAEIREKEKRAEAMLRDAQTKAEVLRQEGQNEHDRLIEEAQGEIEEAKEKASQEGRREGFEAGKAEGRREAESDMAEAIKKANAQAEKTMHDAQLARRSYLEQAEDDVTSLAMQIVEKILPQHFIDVPQVVLPEVQRALEKVKDQKEIIIHVAPQSYDIVLLARDELRSKLSGAGADLTVKSDDSLVPGDCVIETPDGNVDARLKTQLSLIRQALQDVKA